MSEIWKPIPDYPNYEASNRGRVRSLPRVDRAGRKRKGKILKTFYECDVTPAGGVVQHVSVGQLVLRAFKGRPKPGQVAHHLDGNVWHNDLSNLAWRTKKQVAEELVRTGKFRFRGPHTEATKAKLSAARRRRKRKPHTEEARAKISAANEM